MRPSPFSGGVEAEDGADAPFSPSTQSADIHDHGTAFQQRHGIQIYYAGQDSKTPQALANTAHLLTLDNVPKLRQCDNPVSFGIHPAASWGGNQNPEYVRREVDDDLHALLRPGAFVLLVGDPTSGKSRTAFEAVKGKFPEAYILRPEDGAEFDECVTFAATSEKVIWLDDLDRFLSHPGLSTSSLDNALRTGTVLIGTMRAEQLDMLSPRYERGHSAQSRSLVRSARAVTARAHVIYIDRKWGDEEVERARRSADPRVQSASRHAEEYGIAEYLAAGPQLYLEWQNAWAPGLHPRGAALVSAAVDLQRAGVVEPVSRELLELLHEHYLDQRGGIRLRPEPLLDAFHWALEPLHATSSLLVPVAGDMYRAFEYLPEAVARHKKGDGLPDDVWKIAIEDFSLEVTHTVGHRAEKARKTEFAVKAYERLARAGVHDGSFHLGYLAAYEDRLEEAEYWYRQAVSQGNSAAKNNLGIVLIKSGRPDEAIHWFGEAVRGGDSYAMRNLGNHLLDAGKFEEAESLFSSFMNKSPSVAKLLMGQLCISRGDYSSAENWLQQALEDGNNDAWFPLGIAKEKCSDTEGALSAYKRAIKAGNARAVNNLAGIQRKLGNLDEAESLYRSRLEQDDDEYALFNLANLLAEVGRHEEAESLYRKSIDTGFEYAKNDLALMLEELGRGDEAESLLRAAAADGDTQAMANLAARCRRSGDLREALAWINRAMQAGKAGYYTEMGLIQEALGYPNRAMLWYRRAIDGGSSHAAVTLGYLQERKGKFKAARELYLNAANMGNDHALYHLGQYYLARNTFNKARKYLTQAHEAGESVSHMLAYLSMRDGNLVRARQLMNEAAEYGDQDPMVIAIREMLENLEDHMVTHDVYQR
ncbi:tetratricopeptide repeat protein [Streptomyces griseoflavus]|uniref:tetratricopeptide repeat protein n=1 Tax=Streptomyces griseoflavus TaxID=35619 RepID=UPI003D70DD60